MGPDEELTHEHMRRALVDRCPEGAPELQRFALSEGSKALIKYGATPDSVGGSSKRPRDADNGD